MWRMLVGKFGLSTPYCRTPIKSSTMINSAHIGVHVRLNYSPIFLSTFFLKEDLERMMNDLSPESMHVRHVILALIPKCIICLKIWREACYTFHHKMSLEFGKGRSGDSSPKDHISRRPLRRSAHCGAETPITKFAGVEPKRVMVSASYHLIIHHSSICQKGDCATKQISSPRKGLSSDWYHFP